ncbi:MAG: hypothetical protein EXR71_11585 [Myxococcales bacterium]|nr:hypothetical protein [Myxococcales bacterium]
MEFTCLTPYALDALMHPEAVVIEERLRTAPPGVGVRPGVAAPPDARSIYGTPYQNHLETEHFTLNWAGGLDYADGAARAGAALEAGWDALVTTAGWTPSVGSDRYYIWVFLVDDLGGTGLTTEYVTEEFPEGYPVIYLDGYWAADAPFWSSLAVHEFHHALQFALRDWAAGNDDESWYWEASANWASVLVEPESAAFDYAVPWYGDQAELGYSSTAGSHQYGLFVLNGWLDTVGGGPGTMQAVWTAGSSRQDDDWKALLVDTSGLEAGPLWSEFAAAFGNDTYSRGEFWPDPEARRLAADVDYNDSAAELGTVYYHAVQDVRLEVRADAGDEVTVSFPGMEGDAPWLVPAGTTVAVTTTGGAQASWVLQAHSVRGATADTGVEGSVLGRAGCACATGRGARWAWVPVAAGLWAQARRGRRAGRPHAQ